MRTEDYIADNIIALCKKRDMSKYRLSQLTGISQSSIGKIIAKESLPTMPTVVSCKYLLRETVVLKQKK